MKFQNLPKKLKLIQKVTEMSQEELARKLDVSFVTLNSWINAKSTPRDKHKKAIEELYRVYFEKDINESAAFDSVKAKKSFILKESSKRNNLQHILKNPDIYEELLLQVTYNTNSIEGSTLTKADTAAVLFENKSLPGKNLIEHLEAKNHQTAFKYLFDWLDESGAKQTINEQLISKLHLLLMHGILDNAGNYRAHPVRIVGSNVPTANSLKVPELMEDLVAEINSESADVIAKVARIHSKFEQIHPFSDGNGRLGRLLIIAMLLRENIAPAVVQQDQKQEYLDALNKSQLKEDHGLLEDFICDSIIFGIKILNRNTLVS
ncbi:helix-turn-helix domain-containing protein [candidate division WWE3 bacterium]|nr:helix-turn-helix domain-containing protein [candidate division WWE3 bacterium]